MILVRYIPKLCDAYCSKWLKALGRIKEITNLIAFSCGNSGSVKNEFAGWKGKRHLSHFPMCGGCVRTRISEITSVCAF